MKKEVKKTKRKNLKKKVNKKEQFNDDAFWLTMLLSVTSVLLTLLNSYEFIIFNQHLAFSLIVIPIVVFINNYITKKHGFKNSLISIIISTLMIVSFLLLIENLTNQKADMIEIFGYSISYFTGIFVNLLVFYYISTKMSSKTFMLGLNYVFAIALNSFLQLLFFNEMVLTSGLWMQFIISIIIEFIISLALIYLNRKIKIEVF